MNDSLIDNRTIQALESSEERAKGGNKSSFALSSGVVLKAKKVPLFLFKDLESAYTPPPIPIIKDEEKGIEYPNPNDPVYQQKLNKVEFDKQKAMEDILIGMGTAIESIPENLPTPEDVEWADEIEAFTDLTIPDKGPGRYLAWVKYVAVQKVEDINILVAKVAALTGVTEQEVDAAIAAQKSNQTR